MHLQSTCGRTPLPVYHHEHRRASVNLRGLRVLIANCSLEAIDFAILTIVFTIALPLFYYAMHC